MIEVADVFRRFAADYLSAHGASMLPSHQRAIEDILNCRTAALGGQVWRCDTCDTDYHSCNNRSCPKCHTAQIQKWLEHRQAEMLPVPYFHVTVTVPAELREVLRANQRDGYGALMRLSHRSHQRAHRRSRRENGHDPIQGPQDRPRANLPTQRRRVHAPLPPACAAARLPQGPLLRSVASRTTPQCRTGAANVATAGAAQA
jgi:hypothetical protein